MSVKHAEKPGPISKVPGESVIPQNVPEVPATSPARGLKHIRLLTICLIALVILLFADARAAAARERLPGEPCQIEPPRDPKTKKFLWSKPERWVWKQVCEGETANFNKRYRVALDPKLADGWKQNRELSGTFLETILLHERFRSALTRNGVRIVGAWFPNTVDLGHGRLNHQLSLDRSRFESPVSLGSLRSTDLISFIGSKFTGELNMDKLQVGSSLLMHGGAEFADVILRGAKIGGQLSMIGSKFTGKLNLESMEVGGHLLMRHGEFTKPANLIFSTIGSNLDLSGAELRDLDLTGTEIRGEVRLGSGRRPAPKWSDDARLTLRNTEVSALQDRKDAWPENLDLDGFTYERLVGSGGGRASDMAERSADWFIGWLAKDKSFSPQPYEQLATVLRNAGHAGKANDVLYAGKERERGLAAEPRRWGVPLEPRWWGLTLLNYSIGYGYGYRYFYSLFWIAGLVGLGFAVLRLSGEHTKHEIRLGWAYSLDMLLPVIRLRERHYEDVDLSGSARYYFYFHKLMGYVFASFLIAGLSGITK